MAVVDCLEDSDETLRKKTLDLLYTMTKPNNVEVIVERMLAFLGRDGDKYSDKFVREQAASRVAELAERYAPDAKWYVDTMTELFEVAGDVVKPSIGHGLMRLISEGTGDEVADNLSRKSAVDAYLKLFKKPKLPFVLLETVVWVLGEFGEASGETAETLMDTLVDAVEAQSEGSSVETLVLSAIMKISRRSRCGLSDKAQTFVERNLKSKCMEKQQRASEVAAIAAEGESTASSVIQSSATEINVDATLSMMNQYVANALANGAKPYQEKAQRDATAAAAAEARAKEIESRIKANASASRASGTLVFEHRQASNALPSGLPEPLRSPAPATPPLPPKDDLESFLGGVETSNQPPTDVRAPEPTTVDNMKSKLADALFGEAAPARTQRVDPGPVAAFTPPPRGAPTMRAANAQPPPVDLLSELTVSTSAVPTSSVPMQNPFPPVDLMSTTPPKAAPAQSPPEVNGPKSMRGGVAKGNHAKDPFADLFSK